MKYAEYQVWFHAFNTGISAFGSRTDIEPSAALAIAESAGNIALKKYQEVEVPEMPQIPDGFDLNGLVSKVVKDMGSVKGKR